MAVGTIVRFDTGQGYGFIQPDDGGEDVFLHVRTVGEELKDRVRAGRRVEFKAVRGDRGVKAIEAQLLGDLDDLPSALEDKATTGTDDAEGDDSWSAESLRDQITELLITSVPSLTGTQITETRTVFVQLAIEYGWVTE